MSEQIIEAKLGEIAETVLVFDNPGMVEIVKMLLEECVCYSPVRNMLGYTGMYDGKSVSIQGFPMYETPLYLFASQLVNRFEVKRIIKISNGYSLQENVHCHDVVLAMSASSDYPGIINPFNSSSSEPEGYNVFKGMNYAPTADPMLFIKACNMALDMNFALIPGNILSSYKLLSIEERWAIFAEYKVIAADAGTAELYTLASQQGFEALSFLIIDENLITRRMLNKNDLKMVVILEKLIKIALSL